MKRVIYFIILAMSLTLVFSQGKPCCKNKARKGKVSCKFNQTNIDANKDGAVTEAGSQVKTTAVLQWPLSAQNISIDKKNCTNCSNAPWWKFWSKKKSCCNAKSWLQPDYRKSKFILEENMIQAVTILILSHIRNNW